VYFIVIKNDVKDKFLDKDEIDFFL